MSRFLGLGPGLCAVGAVLLVLTGVGALGQWRYEHDLLYAVTLIQMPVYAAGAWLLLKRGNRSIVRPGRALLVILLVGLAMRAVLLPGEPVSTDAWRYIWDGRVQAAGLNPYLYLPADSALAHLRDGVIYPQMNRADYAPTIYAATAQVVFFLVTRISESMIAMKLAMVIFEGLAVWLLLTLLSARKVPPTHILLYAWHPLTAWEFAGSGHVDAVAIAFLMLAFVAADRRWHFLSGAALAAGTFVKYIPIVTAPALYKRWDWRFPLAFVVTTIVLYFPYIGAGSRVTGFLGGYFVDEAMINGQGLFLWALLHHAVSLPAAAYAYYFPVAGIFLLALAGYLFFRRSEPGADLAFAMVLAVAMMVIVSPHWPWYFIWLIPFVCVYPMWSIIYLTCACSVLNFASFPPTALEQSVLYGPFFVILIAEAFVRGPVKKEERHGSTVAA
jgi:alpha-1,6-mannosyltransferase